MLACRYLVVVMRAVCLALTPEKRLATGLGRNLKSGGGEADPSVEACKKSKVQRRGGGPERGGLEKKKSVAEGRLDSGRSLCRNNEDRGEDIK